MKNEQWNTDLRTYMAHKCVWGESHHPDIRHYLPHNISSIENARILVSTCYVSML